MSAVADPVAVALAFVERVNAHDVAGLHTLMTEDHVFIDSLGVVAAESGRVDWAGCFSWIRDYTIEIERVYRMMSRHPTWER